MEKVVFLYRDHEKIEKELYKVKNSFHNPSLIELMDSFFNLQRLWNDHELKEKEFLRDMNLDGELETLFLDHPSVSGHIRVVWKAILSGDHIKIKVSLDTDGRMLVEKLEKHIETEKRLFNELVRKRLISISNIQ